MDFLPAGAVIGSAHQIRTVTLNDSPHLPGGEYTFIDGYCTDLKCDCRKTIIQIMKDGQHVSTIDFGWERPKFYVKWATFDDEMSREMSGISINYASPDLINRDATLTLMKELLDDKWINRIKSTYQTVRTAVKREKRENNIIRLDPKISRNAPCPCGSGKKYKSCCLN